MEYQDKRIDALRTACKGQPKDLIEKWCEGSAKSSYVGDDVVLCRVLREFLMYVDGSDISVSPHLIMRGMWEPWVTMAIARHVRPGWRCIDVGANMGYFTLLLAALATERGHVLAVEPRATVMELLERMVSVNGLGRRVHTLLGGASDRVHEAAVEVPGNLQGGARLVDLAEHADPLPSPTDPELVTCIPLDQLCSGQSWDFIKIDVEGMERRVLEGIRKTLDSQDHVTVAVEVTPFHWEENDLLEFASDFRSRGFSIGMVEREQGRIIDADVSKLPTEEGQWEMLWLKK